MLLTFLGGLLTAKPVNWLEALAERALILHIGLRQLETSHLIRYRYLPAGTLSKSGPFWKVWLGSEEDTTDAWPHPAPPIQDIEYLTRTESGIARANHQEDSG